jgi:hypothetical protein
MIYSFEAKRKFKNFWRSRRISCNFEQTIVQYNWCRQRNEYSCGTTYFDLLFAQNRQRCCLYRESCNTNNLFQAVKYKCISDSYAHSALKALSQQNINNVKEKIDLLCFSLYNAYISDGFKAAKTFIYQLFSMWTIDVLK